MPVVKHTRAEPSGYRPRQNPTSAYPTVFRQGTLFMIVRSWTLTRTTYLQCAQSSVVGNSTSRRHLGGGRRRRVRRVRRFEAGRQGSHREGAEVVVRRLESAPHGIAGVTLLHLAALLNVISASGLVLSTRMAWFSW